MRFIIIVIISSICVGCNDLFIDDKPKYIASLPSKTFVKQDTWKQILSDYSIDNSSDSELEYITRTLQSPVHKTEILYFPSNPKEYIAISSENYDLITSVYNSSQGGYLDNLSSELTTTEKVRIMIRIYNLLMPYLNKEGKKQAITLLNRQISEASTSLDSK